MELSVETIETNKKFIIDLINKIDREGFDPERLIKKLEDSDFFYAPASTRFHNAVRGGLADHCLNVFFNLCSIVKNKKINITETSCIITALFHDISKMNYYAPTVQNKKIYSESGSKQDNMGKYDWVSVPGWTVRDQADRFVFGSHGQTSAYMIGKFIPLTLEEEVAIINHMGGKDSNSAVSDNLTEIYNRYPLACALHVADMLSTYIDEAL